LVTGYAANADIRLALERKEVDSWTSMATTVRLAAAQGIVRPLVRSSRAPVPGLNHLPIDEDLALSDLGRGLMVIRGTPLAIGRPYAVRPGTPPERVAMLREAIARVVADPEFLAEAKAAQIEMDHITAEDVAKRFDAMMSQPADVVEAMHKYIKIGASRRSPAIPSTVMPALVGGIHVFGASSKTWMAGTSQDKPGHDEMDGSARCLRPLCRDRHRHAGDLELHREQRAAGGEVERLPVVA